MAHWFDVSLSRAAQKRTDDVFGIVSALSGVVLKSDKFVPADQPQGRGFFNLYVGDDRNGALDLYAVSSNALALDNDCALCRAPLSDEGFVDWCDDEVDEEERARRASFPRLSTFALHVVTRDDADYRTDGVETLCNRNSDTGKSAFGDVYHTTCLITSAFYDYIRSIGDEPTMRPCPMEQTAVASALAFYKLPDAAHWHLLAMKSVRKSDTGGDDVVVFKADEYFARLRRDAVRHAWARNALRAYDALKRHQDRDPQSPMTDDDYVARATVLSRLGDVRESADELTELLYTAVQSDVQEIRRVHFQQLADFVRRWGADGARILSNEVKQRMFYDDRFRHDRRIFQALGFLNSLEGVRLRFSYDQMIAMLDDWADIGREAPELARALFSARLYESQGWNMTFHLVRRLAQSPDMMWAARDISLDMVVSDIREFSWWDRREAREFDEYLGHFAGEPDNKFMETYASKFSFELFALFDHPAYEESTRAQRRGAVAMLLTLNRRLDRINGGAYIFTELVLDLLRRPTTRTAARDIAAEFALSAPPDFEIGRFLCATALRRWWYGAVAMSRPGDEEEFYVPFNEQPRTTTLQSNGTFPDEYRAIALPLLLGYGDASDAVVINEFARCMEYGEFEQDNFQANKRRIVTALRFANDLVLNFSIDGLSLYDSDLGGRAWTCTSVSNKKVDMPIQGWPIATGISRDDAMTITAISGTYEESVRAEAVSGDTVDFGGGGSLVFGGQDGAPAVVAYVIESVAVSRDDDDDDESSDSSRNASNSETSDSYEISLSSLTCDLSVLLSKTTEASFPVDAWLVDVSRLRVPVTLWHLWNDPQYRANASSDTQQALIIAALQMYRGGDNVGEPPWAVAALDAVLKIFPDAAIPPRNLVLAMRSADYTDVLRSVQLSRLDVPRMLQVALPMSATRVVRQLLALGVDVTVDIPVLHNNRMPQKPGNTALQYVIIAIDEANESIATMTYYREEMQVNIQALTTILEELVAAYDVAYLRSVEGARLIADIYALSPEWALKLRARRSGARKRKTDARAKRTAL